MKLLYRRMEEVLSMNGKLCSQLNIIDDAVLDMSAVKIMKE